MLIFAIFFTMKRFNEKLRYYYMEFVAHLPKIRQDTKRVLSKKFQQIQGRGTIF